MQPNQETIQPFGGILGYAPGNVPAYSSDYATAVADEYPNRRAYRSYYDGIYMGYKWQCVEFARRWLYINRGYIFNDIAMAYDIFELRSVRDVVANNLLPLNAFSNGCTMRPTPGSLLIWQAGGEFQDTGHVAVITEVSDEYVRICEQNVDHRCWPRDHDYARQLRARVGDNGEYWIECSYGDAEILGWMIQTDDTSRAEPTPGRDDNLFAIKALRADTHNLRQRAWLNIANDDESAYVEAMGGPCLTRVSADQNLYYALSHSAREALEYASNELHGLFMHATDYVLAHDELLEKFNLPGAVLPKIRQSWDNRLNQLITSRFDFALTRSGLKVYEYNCDSASCYMEAGKIQGKWAHSYAVGTGEDAGGKLFGLLAKAWRNSRAKGLVHILRDDDPEEKYHALFMREAIRAAGLESRVIVGLEGLHWDASGNILDADGNRVNWVWKTWAWETALDQIRRECEQEQSAYEPRWQSGAQPRLSDVLLREHVMVFEPLWTLIPSNKAILPVLWSMFPNHPLLLNSSFELSDELTASGYVTKPIVGRCGANISLVDDRSQLLESTGGAFANQHQMYQQLFPLPRIGDYHVQVSTFTAAGIYAGSSVRVDRSLVLNKDSDCLPLRFVDDNYFLALDR